MASVPPSVQGSVLLGCTRELQRDQLGTYARAMAAHGDIARFRVGPPGIGFTFDAVFAPEGARQVLAADSAHYVKDAPVISEFTHFLGNGLLVSKGERWRTHRRIVQPLFTRRAVENHLDTIAAAAGDLVSWCAADAAADRPIDLHRLSMRYALHWGAPSSATTLSMPRLRCGRCCRPSASTSSAARSPPSGAPTGGPPRPTVKRNGSARLCGAWPTP